MSDFPATYVCQDVPGHMGWLNCPTHNREIMAKIQTLHAKPEQTTSDQSNPHASHCSCKYEVEALRKEIDKCLRALAVADVLVARSEAQVPVVEAARAWDRAGWTTSYDEAQARRNLERAIAALDKATEVRG